MQEYDENLLEMGEVEKTPEKRVLLRKNDEFASRFHMSLVFPLRSTKNGGYERTEHTRKIIHALVEGGLEVFPYQSKKEDDLICLVRLPEDKMKKFAEKTNFKLKFMEEKAAIALDRGWTVEGRQLIKPIVIHDVMKVSRLKPTEYIYGTYREELHDLFVDDEFPDCFTPSVTLKLLMAVMEGAKSDGGCNLAIVQLESKNYIQSYYPLHQREAKKLLEKKWLKFGQQPWLQPFDDIKGYFGEKVGLYFKFISHLSSWLYVPGIVGLPLQLIVWITQNYSHPVLPFYGVLICVWSISMLEYWKRVEKTTAMEWGMVDFEKSESVRPEYEGEIIRSYINGFPMKYFPAVRKRNRLLMASTFVLALILMVLGTVLGIYIFRFQLEETLGTLAAVVASSMNTVQISVFNVIYGTLAKMLNDFENHQTDTQYEDSMINKTFFFQFVNSYSSFFFIAFIAQFLQRPTYLSDDPSNIESQFVGECGWLDCMKPLSLNLAIIYGVRLTVTNFVAVYVPWKKNKMNMPPEPQEGERQLSQAEKESLMVEYDPIMDPIARFSDVSIQYGFMTMFITALPIATLCSIGTNMVRIQTEGFTLLSLVQRPVPASAEDIGSWQSIFEFISIFAVVTNGALICFTMSVIDGYSFVGRVWIFIGFLWTLITVQYIIQAAVPDETEETLVQIDRQAFIVSKLIDHVPDEDDETDLSAEQISAKPEVIIHDYPVAKDGDGQWITKLANLTGEIVVE